MHAEPAIRFFMPEYGCMPIERLSIKRMRDLRVSGISSCFSRPKFQISNQYVHAIPLSSLTRKATNKITDKLPVHSFVFNLTILIRKQNCKQGMWKVGEPRRQDRFGKKYHGYAPESQVQNSLQAQRCRVQCYDFGVRKKLFQKRLVRALAIPCILAGMCNMIWKEIMQCVSTKCDQHCRWKWKIQTFVLYNAQTSSAQHELLNKAVLSVIITKLICY